MPLFNFSKLRARAEMLKHLPTGPYWFSEGDLVNGQIGRLVNAIAENIGLFTQAAHDVRRNLFLNTADGDGLTRWGQDLQLERRVGESVEDYRSRLRAELLRLRATRQAVETYVEDLTGFEATVFLPWKFQDWRDQRTIGLPFGATDPFYGRSGQTRRTSTYWQGGVIDIQTKGHSLQVQKLISDVVAAGIQVYFSNDLDEMFINDEDFQFLPTGATGEVSIFYDVVVDRLTPVFIRSSRGLRSGHTFLSMLDEITYGLLVNSVYEANNEDNVAEIFQFDLFPPIRSVYTFPRSPRSGALGESFFEETEPYVFGDDQINSAVNNFYSDVNVEYTMLGLITYGTRRSDGLRKSGWADPYFIVDLFLENPLSLATHLWDNPDWNGPYSVYDNAQTWESLENYTWDEALENHSGQATADVVLSA